MSSVTSNGQFAQNVVRQTASFKPSVCTDRFLNYEFETWERHVVMEKELSELKKDVRMMLIESPRDSFDQLKLIDDIQLLGVEYHFEREIVDALEFVYDVYLKERLQHTASLHHVSLRFRLLRQLGLSISCDTLNQFRDANGKFEECLATDVEGLLSLYEASFLSLRGETTLDEAFIFSNTCLEALLKGQSYPFSNMIGRALSRPLWKSLVRVNAAHFISIYIDLPSYNEILLRFAKLDYNLLQSLHKKELSELCKWRKDLDFARKFPFAREKIVECCYWIFVSHFEPQYSLSRRIVSKALYLITIIDDIYDAYGTFQELRLFTSVTRSWNGDKVNELPEYMQVCYRALVDFFKETEEEMIKQGTYYRFSYIKQDMIKQIEYYYEEAKWLSKNYQPTFDEYINLASKSIGLAWILTISISGNSFEGVKKDDFEWLANEPEFLQAAEMNCRLLDDLVSYKIETQRKHISTSLECYTKQYMVSKDEAIIALNQKILGSWKDLNKGMMKPTSLARALLTRILHLVRSMEELYKEEDAFTNNGKCLQERISAMFVDAFPLGDGE